MKKFTKIILITIMFAGICFSIFNFFSVEVKGITITIKGAYVYSGGQLICMGDGTDCTIGMYEFK
jgi:hypothetical protein